MLTDVYNVEALPDLQTFEFVSIGPKGNITKAVIYTKVNQGNLYNLGFGDKDLVTGNIDDMIVTDNGDSQKVLTTVSLTLLTFMENHPDAAVVVAGSTESRTRLYKMGISNNLMEIEKMFTIRGLTRSGWKAFKKDENYFAFLVSKNK